MLGGTLSKSSEKGIIDADISAILLENFPFWVNYHRVPDIKTALMKDWEKKLDQIAIQALNEDITNLTGVPSWMLILLKRVLKLSNKNKKPQYISNDTLLGNQTNIYDNNRVNVVDTQTKQKIHDFYEKSKYPIETNVIPPQMNQNILNILLLVLGSISHFPRGAPIAPPPPDDFLLNL